MQIAVRKFLLVELNQRTLANRLREQVLPLLGAAVKPDDVIGLAEVEILGHPVAHGFIRPRGRG